MEPGIDNIKEIIDFEVCSHRIYIENDPLRANLINIAFPSIYVITLSDKKYINRQIYTKHVLKKIGANYTLCYMNTPDENIYTKYLEFYKSLPYEEKLGSPIDKNYKTDE